MSKTLSVKVCCYELLVDRSSLFRRLNFSFDPSCFLEILVVVTLVIVTSFVVVIDLAYTNWVCPRGSFGVAISLAFAINFGLAIGFTRDKWRESLMFVEPKVFRVANKDVQALMK